MEQQVWSVQHARQSTLRPRVAVPSSHRAFQDHAAYIVEWSTMLRPNGSWGTCIPQGVIHSLNALHGAPLTDEEEGLKYEQDLWQQAELGLTNLRTVLQELDQLERQRGVSQ
jgi:hypothetical protein